MEVIEVAMAIGVATAIEVVTATEVALVETEVALVVGVTTLKETTDLVIHRLSLLPHSGR